MHKLLIVIGFGLGALAATAKPATNEPAPATPATPAVSAAPAAPAAAQDPAARRQAAQREVDKLKKELQLTDAQAVAWRNEIDRFRAQLATIRAEHRANVSKILTPEQMVKLEQRRRGMRAGAEDHDDDGDDDDKPKAKDKDKKKGGK